MKFGIGAGLMVRSLPLAVLALGMHVPAAGAPAADPRALLERAGRLSEMADREAGEGHRPTAIGMNRDALKLIDRALAAGADPAQVEPGRRMIQLDLADWLLAEQDYEKARDLYRDVAALGGGGLIDYFRTRALKGLVGAEAGLGNRDGMRAVLAQLIAEGRAKLAADPHNVFLTRQLAEFLETDTFVRYWTDNGEVAMRASAAETLDLFRAVAEANPDSGEARRAVFAWAWVNAKLTNDIPYWKEAQENGRWLQTRNELKGRQAMLAEVERKMEIYERKGALNIGD